MRVPFAIMAIAFTALQGPANAAPLRACAQVATLVDGAVSALLANQEQPHADTTRLREQFRDCVSSRNICSVVSGAHDGKEALIAADVTADLPASNISAQGRYAVIFLARSIPRVHNDSNQYCLVSAQRSDGNSVQPWDVYGWVMAPNASAALPLPRQGLDDKAASESRSPRSLAAALWSFAERMSGRPSPPEKRPAE
jgi:hypothetical protein